MKAWLAVCALLAGGSIATAALWGFPDAADDWLAHPLVWQSADWLTHPWTLWTSAWVHTSSGNLAGNLLALAAIAVMGSAVQASWRAALALAVAWPLSTLALLLWPAVTAFAGLGGVIHAAAMVVAVAVSRRPALKPLAPLLLAGMGLKLLAEQAWRQPVAFDPSWGFNVVYAAHLTGAVAGLACGEAALFWKARPA